MDIRQLRYALTLAEHRHFGRAAAAVGIAQPPLSKAITQLEAELGVRLFDRTSRGVFPTAAEDALLARARRIDQELSATALDAQRAARGETGSLRVGFIGYPNHHRTGGVRLRHWPWPAGHAGGGTPGHLGIRHSSQGRTTQPDPGIPARPQIASTLLAVVAKTWPSTRGLLKSAVDGAKPDRS